MPFQTLLWKAHVLKKLGFEYLFFYRYVDYILTYGSEEKIDELISGSDNYHKDLKFTIETEKDSRLTFIDVKIIRNDSLLITDWHRNELSSGRYTNFHSNICNKDKINFISLTDRVIGLDDVRFRGKTRNCSRLSENERFS